MIDVELVKAIVEAMDDVTFAVWVECIADRLEREGKGEKYIG